MQGIKWYVHAVHPLQKVLPLLDRETWHTQWPSLSPFLHRITNSSTIWDRQYARHVGGQLGEHANVDFMQHVVDLKISFSI